MKPYPAYKDSGVEWLGEVPAHWISERLKYCLTLINDKNVDDTTTKIALENIESWTGNYLETSTEFAGDGVVFKRDDILFGKLRPYLAKVWQAEFNGNAVGDIFVYRANKAIVPRFAFYRFISRDFIDIVNGSTFGAKMPRASSEFIGNLTFAYPPPAEQTAIAAYLDRKTAQIDALIERKRRLIDLLQEERTAVISLAVTKGLAGLKIDWRSLEDCASLPPGYKDSGIEWIGAVPAGWEIIKLAYFVEKITNGYVGPTRNILQESGIRYIQSLHVKGNTINFRKPYFVSEEWSRKHERSILREGDVLVVQTGAMTGEIGIVPKEFDGANCHALIILRASRDKGIGAFLLYVLTSDYGYNVLMCIRTGALHPHLNSTYIRDIYIPVPPRNEQQSIVEFIESENRKINASLAKIEKQIELLQEYRTALISAVVTGKVDVRGE